MFSHVMLGANDIQQSKTFYDATLAVLGYPEGVIDPKGRCFYFSKHDVFALTKPIDGQPASKGNGSTIGFSAKSADEVNAWHAAGLANGGVAIEDAPGVREGAGMKLYLAYLLDPAGNKVCAMYRMP
ncbi:Catechol 2,3-dioxygenase [Atopomonas hussainii]|uniref:Catechol 2,3-dioxygenase n=1 Tax=Atopomonas hussainii TaxID=1429083 RepID=A0A1H7NI42_9GAMM|nr:VOC family protein [Atopomonas hussainii]SEL23173.1 Catechol 2,3-dioxygenase [Atopomonas hussainii]